MKVNIRKEETLFYSVSLELNQYRDEHFHEAADELVKLEVNHARQDSNL